MRQCPKCNFDLQAHPQPHGGAVYVCDNCGWGSSRLVQEELQAELNAEPSRHVPLITWLKLPVFWALSLLVVFGPYLAIVYGIPAFTDAQDWGDAVTATPERLAASITPTYWYIVIVYLLLAAILKGEINFDNLGMFGTMIDNPFTLEDDWNRSMLLLGFLLLPGKIVIFTLAGTGRVIKRLATGRV